MFYKVCDTKINIKNMHVWVKIIWKIPHLTSSLSFRNSHSFEGNGNQGLLLKIPGLKQFTQWCLTYLITHTFSTIIEVDLINLNYELHIFKVQL
jgi:hypothetical protein